MLLIFRCFYAVFKNTKLMKTKFVKNSVENIKCYAYEMNSSGFDKNGNE